MEKRSDNDILYRLLLAGYDVKVEVFDRAFGTGIRVKLKSRETKKTMTSDLITWIEDIPSSIERFAIKQKVLLPSNLAIDKNK